MASQTLSRRGLPECVEPGAVLGEPEESLVADPRGALSAVQMIDRRLLTLLGAGSPDCYTRAAGPQGPRRSHGG
jgi:hypothetical protein